MNKVTHI